MIQIIGIRMDGTKAVEAFTDKNWCPNSVFDLIERPTQILSVIPEDEKVDLFFTTHHIKPETKREFAYADTLIFEVTNLKEFHGSLTDGMRIIAILSEMLDVGPDLFSGLHTHPTSFAIVLPLAAREVLRTPLEMQEAGANYKDLCFDFEFSLRQEGFTSAKVNKKAWGLGTMLRVPGTRVTEKGETWNKDSKSRLSVVAPAV